MATTRPKRKVRRAKKVSHTKANPHRVGAVHKVATKRRAGAGKKNGVTVATTTTKTTTTTAAVGGAGSVILRAYSNGANIFIAWKMTARIKDCIGFALKRKTAGAADVNAVILSNHIGFEGTSNPINAAPTSSLQAPFQRCTWNDWTAPDQVQLQYQVVAVYDEQAAVTTPAQSDWSAPVSVGINAQTGKLQAYFNDGVIATQWIARELAQPGVTPQSLMQQVQTPGSQLRARLGGTALPKLRELLTTTKQHGGHVFAALFELSDPELVGLLKQLGGHAHVVLGNGTGSKRGGTFHLDENAAARAELKHAGVDVKDRILPAAGNTLPHFAHNKFAVFTDGNERPTAVWTGSVNWTDTGLCTQMNNAVLVSDAGVASRYLDQWNGLAKAKNKFPPYARAKALPKALSLGSVSVLPTFTPFDGTRGQIANGQPADLAYCTQLINNAKEGALFFFFNPGPKGTLLNAVSGLQGRDNFYIRGVVNQDPNPKDPGIPDPANPHVQLLHRNQNVLLPDEAAAPEAINESHSFWLKEHLRLGNVMVHSKVVVLDPFGDNPMVMTGSHNMGTKASIENDENLIIIQGDSALAVAYAVNVVTVFNQYWWRYNRFEAANQKKGTAAVTPTLWPALKHDDTWQDRFIPGGNQQYEVDFWVP